jgi:hypothetical protein
MDRPPAMRRNRNRNKHSGWATLPTQFLIIHDLTTSRVPKANPRVPGAEQCQCSIPSLSNAAALYRTRLYAPYTAMVPERRKPKPLQSGHPLPQLHA